ncbi:hypothetical protein MSG28_001650 [Choristoneura fumiferana]|uniref:Uncharacterized protein n=1 Tax=Choristoneura fumiferana TaxID=7141 RepID=A0ACC0KVI4_CHOFU|nr:hypothetical protein MSG28_001650 [Choristoneura fumiferana]
MTKDAMTRQNKIWKKKGITINTKIRLLCFGDVVLETNDEDTLDGQANKCVDSLTAQD